ncbi:MAG: MBL fold metallo-hydrolase [Clostridiales bacterium]|nr:MBL fold metallo-hydrolase [Clostridiales bacterium]
MASSRKKAGNKRKPALSIGLAVVVLLSLFITAAQEFHWSEAIPTWNDIFGAVGLEPEVKPVADGEMQVHFVDVGQADCILVTCNGKNMLIDAGNNADGDGIVQYLNKQGIEKLDLVIGTHPHEDHIGGLDNVIDAFEVGTVIMPKIPDSIVPTTKTYTSVLKSIQNKGLKITTPKYGSTYELSGAVLTILGPVADYSDLNNMSVVCRLVYGDTSFLFTGDAEAEAEEDILKKSPQLESTVLKFGHHGSSTSSSEAWLDAVKPKYGVIMCETGNKYGHPHRETLDAMKGRNIYDYRTDLDGTVLMTSDGKNISTKTEKGRA